uniref:Heat shock protein 70 family n=1 Tax=Meloidogyne hapla TaxID=6305 RepID=A0A1I8B1K0_MELHA
MIRCLRPSFNRFSVRNLRSKLRGPVIGINFGFTNSSVAILEDRKAKNSEGSRLTPSVVAFTKDDRILVGAPALRQSFLNSQNTIFGVKRLIGREYNDKDASNGYAWIEAHGNIYSPPQIASFILTKLRKTAENYLNKKVVEAIITVHAYFNDSQRDFIIHACKLANIKVLSVFNEPTAAAFAYGLCSTTVVFNLGGGTLELSILKSENDDYEVISTFGDSFLGGVNFDNAIVKYLVGEFKRENGIDLTQDPKAMQRLREAAEKAKCELSSSFQTEIIIPYISVETGGPKHLKISLSRSKFEELTANLIQRIEELCKKAMENAKLEPDTYEVLLVGGMTRMPKIQQIVEQIFGKKPYVPEIDECSVTGAIALKDETALFKDGTIIEKDELVPSGVLYLGVHSGDINYVNGQRITTKNFAEASQKLYYVRRKIDDGDDEDNRKMSKIHIDIKSTNAVKALGFFLFDKVRCHKYNLASFWHIYNLFSGGSPM